MKRSLNILTILFVVCAAVLFFYLFRSSETASASASAFAGFPLNEPRPISFDVNHEALEDKTRREKLDQMRDWLLYAVVSDSGKSTRELGEILYDLPATRNGYMHPVGNFEFGVTRSRMIGDGEVVAVVPGDNTPERLDQLAHIADEHRKNSGELPKSILVFDYKLNLDGEQSIPSGEITRRETIDGKELFTPKYGYHERTIKSLDDLKQFMTQIDDVVFAQQDGGALKLGGRKIQGRTYRGISVEDVAALWQSEENLSSELPGSGFSLDPSYHFDKVKHFFKNTLVPLSEMFGSYDSELDDYLSNLPYRHQFRSNNSPTEAQVSAALDNCDIKPLFAWIDNLRSTTPELFEFLKSQIPGAGQASENFIEEAINKEYGFQIARYDGDLRGTQVGMVLFYTDLVAKLWDFDYKESTPREIEDFKSELVIRTQLSPVFHKQVEEMPWARLWFGPDARGYEAVDKTLLFTRRATRLFAKSSTSVAATSEAEPDAATALFINWWDDHYEEVARYEPQYERLNQIMKWSILVTWLRQAQQSQQLGFLKDRNLVNREHRFPTWVKQQPDLRFNKWSDDMFLPSTNSCVTTEALPLLDSAAFAPAGEKSPRWRLTGGVSLSNRTMFAERTFLSAESKVAALARRSGVDYAPFKSADDVVQFVGGPKYKLTNLTSNRLAITATPKSEAILRNRYGDLASGNFQQVIANESKAFQIATKYGNTGVGDLSIARTGNGFRIGWESRQVDLSHSLARKLSVSNAPDELLATNPRVESAIKLAGEEGYLVKLKGAEQWTRLKVERNPSVDIGTGWQARVADTQSSSKPYTVAWMDQARVNAELGEAQYIVLNSGQTSGAARIPHVTGNAPSPGARQVALVHGEQRINAVVDPNSGSLYVRYRDLPEALQKNPGQLQRAISRTDAGQLQRNAVLHLPDGQGSNLGPLGREIQSKNFDTLSKELSRSPRDFKLQLENHLRDGLKQSDELLVNRDYATLQKNIDDLIEVFGPRPELTIRKGVAQIRNRQTLSAARGFDESLIQHQSGPRQIFFDEINLRLRTTTPPEETLVQFVDEGQSITAHCHLKNLPAGAKVKGHVDELKSGVLYIEDSPRLRNLDWHTNPQVSLNEVISGEFGEVIRLPRGDLNNFRPTRIYVEDVAQTFNPIRTRTTQYRFRHPAALNPNSRCDDENESENRCGDVYIIRTRQPN